MFGDLTLAAVKKYQSRAGLRVDGLVGTQTINALYRRTGEKIGSAMVLDIGSVSLEVGHVKRYLAAQGYDVPFEGGDNYTEALSEVVKEWQRDIGANDTGAVTENQYNKYVLGLD